MRFFFNWTSLSAAGCLLLIIATGCSNPAMEAGVAKSEKQVAPEATKTNFVSATIGDQLSPANFGNAEFASSIIDSKKPVIVDFSATWCGPCQQLKPILHELEEEGVADVVMIDTDQHPDIANAFRVQGIPHLLFIKDGKLIETATGFQGKKELISVIEKLGS